MRKKTEKPKRGRPSTYTAEKAIALCALIAERSPDTGRPRGLKDAAEEMGISERTVFKWLLNNAEFAQLYARARLERADMLADDIVDISDEEPDPQKARVRIDARKWWAAKVNPKRYGDKVDHTIKRVTNVGDATDDELLNIARGGSEGAAAEESGADESDSIH